MLTAQDAHDAFALAARQVELDRAALAGAPWLADRKKARLSPSPFAFLRGSAPLFYETLAARPELARGPEGDGWIVGDMHLENVGAYRDDAGEVVFGLNDFDDATVGPLRYDVLRLSTSVLLAARSFQATGAQAIDLVEHAIASYLRARAGGAAPPVPREVRELIDRASARSQKDLLDDRAPEAHGKRSFLLGPRYHALPADLAARVPTLLAAYLAALGPRVPGHASEWTIEDAAFRVAGNGSLGVIRVAVLVRDHEGQARLVELKQCNDSSTTAVVTPPPGLWSHPGERVANAARALCLAPPRLLAPVRLDGLSFVGRRLFPQEDKLAVDQLRVGDALGAIVGFIGHVLGAGHARGVMALGGPTETRAPWSTEDIGLVVDHAVVLAGVLEGAYLAWARRS